MRRWTGLFIVGVLVCSGLFTGILGAGAAPPANAHFQRTWARTDQPVAMGQVSRTWMWGPEAFTGELQEPYAESPGGMRAVQYFDKARMEITNPGADSSSIWYVTNGLLVVELITGRLQSGNNQFEQRSPAVVNVAGDGDDPTGPTYATFGALLDAAPAAVGTPLTYRLSRDGQVTSDPALAAQGLTVAVIDEVTNHAIAGPFWDFMTSSGLVWDGTAYVTAPLFENAYFATGRPITEAYWARVKVGGTYQDVLMQCFERRCLTYNPANPLEWRVEAGNVGQHYYAWRYEQPDGEPSPPQSPSPEPSPTQPDEPATEYAYAFDFGRTVRSSLRLEVGGLAVDAEGVIYAAESAEDRIAILSADGEYLGSMVIPGAVAGLFNPVDVAMDASGHIYAIDNLHNRITKFQNGEVVSQFGSSGNGPGQLQGAWCLTLRADIIYVCDRFNHRISRFSTSGIYLDSFGTSAEGPNQLKDPVDVAVASDGRVYVADADLATIKVFSPALQFERTLELPAGHPPFGSPKVTVAPDGMLWVVDTPSPPPSVATRITRFAADGRFVDVWGTSDTIPGLVNWGGNIEVGADGYVYVSGGQYLPNESSYFRLSKFRPDGVIEWAITDDNRGRFDEPFEVAVASNGTLLITDATDTMSRIDIWQPDGTPAALDGIRFYAKLPHPVADAPTGIAVAPDGTVYVADSSYNLVSQFNTDWEPVRTWDASASALGPFKSPHGIATDAAGNVYVADTGNAAIRKFTADGTVLGSWGSAGNGPGQFMTPIDIVVAGERVYVTDQALHRVTAFDLNGTYLTAWGELGDGPGQFSAPRGIAADADGYIYVVDSGNARVQKFTPDGEWFATFGGGGARPLSQPQGIAVTANGMVYVVDRGNDRVVVYEPRR